MLTQIRTFLQRLFPGLFWWRRRDPVELILSLPEAGQEALLADFFRHRAVRYQMPTSTPSTRSAPVSGPPSAPPPSPTLER